MSLLIHRTLNGYRFGRLSIGYVCVRNLATPTSQDKLVDTLDDNDIEKLDDGREAEIENICNKSRLRPEHRNILFNQKPYSEPVIKAHHTVKYNRKLYGKYGGESGVNPGIMWPTKDDLKERTEFEKIAYPLTIEEMVKAARDDIEEKENEKQEIHKRVMENMGKLEMWKKQLRDTIAKKHAAALAAKEKKDKLIEDVRRHFGFTVDPRDERFKEMLAQKEKEQKKKDKQAKSAEKEKKAIAKLMEKHKSDLETD